MQSTHLSALRKNQFPLLLSLCPPWIVIFKLSSHYIKLKPVLRAAEKIVLSDIAYRVSAIVLGTQNTGDHSWFCLDRLCDLAYIPTHSGDSSSTLLSQQTF